jgi:hypothetical protein
VQREGEGAREGKRAGRDPSQPASRQHHTTKRQARSSPCAPEDRKPPSVALLDLWTKPRGSAARLHAPLGAPAHSSAHPAARARGLTRPSHPPPWRRGHAAACRCKCRSSCSARAL